MSNNSNKNTEAIENFVNSVKLFQPEFKSLNYEKDNIENYLLDNYNYILTEKAKERLDKLYTYITYGIPVLLEGETGTSKALSAEIICKHMSEIIKNNAQSNDINEEESYIKFNLSAEVKINDLM